MSDGGAWLESVRGGRHVLEGLVSMSGWSGAARASAAGLALAVAICAAPAPAAMAGPAATSPNPYDRCSEMADADQRLACFDAVQKARGRAPAPQAVQRKHRKKFGLQAPRFSPKPSARGRSRASQDEVAVELAKVGRAHDGMIWFVTTDGAIWRQTEPTTVAIAPSPGDHLKIRRAAVGSYLCDMSRWQSVRCERTQAEPR